MYVHLFWCPIRLTASGKNISKMESREAGSSKILSIGGKASYNIVKVPKAPLMACLTCTLCNNLFFEATTICECLHTCKWLYTLCKIFMIFFRANSLSLENHESCVHNNLFLYLTVFCNCNCMPKYVFASQVSFIRLYLNP
ncbi:hypothetical protein O6H91_Y283700 [Diphasiastrum complanatum]|nr:hypothetical protein O6H91_Y283700 [Diphasiastrum complanatum]